MSVDMVLDSSHLAFSAACRGVSRAGGAGWGVVSLPCVAVVLDSSHLAFSAACGGLSRAGGVGLTSGQPAVWCHSAGQLALGLLYRMQGGLYVCVRL